MNPLYVSAPVVVCYDNDNDAYIPELWANEGLAILEENMVMANLVHRDFQNEVASFGDVVNTRRPHTRKGRRRTDSDDYTEADAKATNVRVPLDQWFYDSFIIKDGEASKSFQDLVVTHLRPAMQNIARMADRAVLGRVHNFLKSPLKRAGRLLNMSSSNAKNFVLEAREILNVQKAPMEGRNIVLSPSSETALLQTDLFVAANQRGDGGNALENALLGRILGFQTYMDQNVNGITVHNADIVTGTITNALAAGGSGSQSCTITGYEVVLGEFAVVAGNDQPTWITNATASTNTTAITLNEANKYATAPGAVVTVYKSCAVKGTYSVGHSKEVVLDGFTANKGPQVGQLVAFGTGASRHTYTVIEVTETSSSEYAVLLDRPLEIGLSDNQPAFPGPAGSMNLAFHRDAIALVTRPVRLPPPQEGVAAASATYNGVNMRVVMQYDSKKGGTRVNLDILAGTAILDEDLAVVMLG